MNPVLSIQNLTWQYPNDTRLTLDIPLLEIPRGQLTMILGVSGCGKTTLLETLGLMNHRPVGDSCIYFYPEPGSALPASAAANATDALTKYDYREVWQDPRHLAQLRREYFSFIFQDPDMVPSLPVDENITIPQLVQGKTIGEALEAARQGMKQVRITDKFGQDKAPMKLSGGEQQRAAFVRARLADHTLLFGDEPTGNLGTEDAHTILHLIRHHIDSSAGKHSALLVTHYTQLAAAFADRIIVMSKEGKVKGIFCSQPIGEAPAQKRRWWWLGHKEKPIDDFKALLDDLLTRQGHRNNGPLEVDSGHSAASESSTVEAENPSDITIPKPASVENQASQDKSESPTIAAPKTDEMADELKKRGLHAHDTLHTVMVKRVRKAFSYAPRKQNKLSYLLLLILFFAIAAIGFAGGSRIYLAEKVSDPFVNWVDVVIPAFANTEVSEIKVTLLNSDAPFRATLNEVTGYYQFPLFIWGRRGDRSGTYRSYGRTIEFMDPILSPVGSSDNLLRGSMFQDDRDTGVIVTQVFLQTYGYADDALFIDMSFSSDSIDQRPIPLPIRGIVRELPGKSDFITTSFFHEQYTFNPSQPYHPRHTTDLLLFVEEVEGRDSLLFDAVQTFFDAPERRALNPFINPSPEADDSAYRPGISIRINFLPQPSLEMLDDLFAQLQAYAGVKDIPFIRSYDHPYDNALPREEYDRLSLHLSSMDEIDALKAFLEQQYALEIDMTVVEKLRNYNFVSKLTKTLSVVIIFICALSISIFVYYIFYLHLYKMRTSIGSIKAFGASDSQIRNIYMSIFVRYMGFAISFTLLAAAFIGYMGGVHLVLSDLEPGEKYFDLFNGYMLFFLIAVVGVSYMSVRDASTRILNQTPGNLIYDKLED